ncbi:alkaline phosphatase [Cellulosilyticum sp. I15G10I2]|uniref:alkaline phosphatase n=1 Tax=Cellulosilyticum sp. I15G10I2 TaxID=1892843 RepID=UPI00085C92A9|nr:alkaline phosphatase [Cellulosilyticum sp. I15G10I2]
MFNVKRHFKTIITSVLALVVSFGILGLQTQAVSAQTTQRNTTAKKAKYVFMFIGDGMSATQANAAEIYLGSLKNSAAPELVKLNFSKFPVQGLKTTYAADSFIPDSASSGTAMASGYKTVDGVINMDPAKKVKYTSMAESAKKSGMKVGIVSSVSIDHATPAVFYAHQTSRNNYYDIALELGKSGFDYFGGGGFNQPTGKNKDQEDVYEIVKRDGYTITRTKEDFEKINKQTGKVYAVNPVLDKSNAMPYAINQDSASLSLADFTRKGIEVLENPQGFFMMVESGKIDWACHANDAATSIKEVIAFEEAIAEAIKFYQKHPNDTLIVVTGDHETGGLGIGFAGTKYNTSFPLLKNQKISYDEFDKVVAQYRASHTPETAKIEDFYGVLSDKMGLNNLKELELNQLKEALKVSMLAASERPTDDKTYLLYGGYEPLSITVTHILNQRAGIGWTTYAHTGVPVPLYAIGQGSEIFSGYYDDTDTYQKFMSVMKLASK